MEEIWKDVPGYSGYQASNLGRIRTHNKTTYTERHGIRHWKDRILKPKKCRSTANKDRYDERISLWKDGKEKTFLVARVIAASFLEKSELTVNHIDGNSLNNNIENLEYVSRKENIVKGFETHLYPQKKIIIKFKATGEIREFRSMSEAERQLGITYGHFSNLSKKGKNHDKDFEWEVGEYKKRD